MIPQEVRKRSTEEEEGKSSSTGSKEGRVTLDQHFTWGMYGRAEGGGGAGASGAGGGGGA